MNLICACCGGNALGKQWPNQDTGYGICSRCFAEMARKEGLEQAIFCHGSLGVHHSPERDPEWFTYPQIEKLRTEFDLIQTVCVDDGATIYKIEAFLKKLPTHQVRQLAEAKIKFLSVVAAGILRKEVAV